MFRIRTPHQVDRVRPAIATDPDNNESTLDYSGGATTNDLRVHVQFKTVSEIIVRNGREIDIVGVLYSRTKSDWQADDVFGFDGVNYRIENVTPYMDVKGVFNHIECEFSRATDR